MYVYSCTRARSPILCTKVTYHPPVMNQRPELRPSISCAGRVDRWSRSGQRFETHTPSHERCLRVVARRAVEVRRIESSHASPRAPARATRASGASPVPLYRIPSKVCNFEGRHTYSITVALKCSPNDSLFRYEEKITYLEGKGA